MEPSDQVSPNSEYIVDAHVLDKKKTWLICPTCKNFPSIDTMMENDQLLVRIKCKCKEEDEIYTIEEYLNILKTKKTLGTFCDMKEGHENYQAVNYCFNCDKFLCSFCLSFHKSTHKDHKISDEAVHIDTKCKKHKENNTIVSYCKDCEENLCYICMNEHDKLHDVVLFSNYFVKSLFDEKKKDYEKFKELQSKRDEIKNELVNTIKNSRDNDAKAFIEQIEKVYELNTNVNNNFDSLLTLIFQNYDDTAETTPNFNLITNSKKLSTFNLNSYCIKEDKSLIENAQNFINFYKSNYCIKLPDTPFEKTLTQNCSCRGICKICEIPNEMIVVSTWNNSIEFYSLPNLEHVSSQISHFAPAITLLPLRSGELATGSKDFTINIWDPLSFEVLSSLDGHEGPVSKLVEMPDRRLVSSSWDKTLKVWSPDGQELSVLEGHIDRVTDVVILRNGNLASCGFDGMVKVWNEKTYICEHTITFENVKCYMLLSLQDGRVAVSVKHKETGACKIKILEKNTLTEITEIDVSEVATSLIQLEDGRVVISTKDHISKVYDTNFNVLFGINEIFENNGEKAFIGQVIQLKNGKILCENEIEISINMLC